MAAEIAVLPTWPDVDTNDPVTSAYVRSAHQLPVGAQPLAVCARMPVRLGIMQQLQLPRIALA